MRGYPRLDEALEAAAAFFRQQAWPPALVDTIARLSDLTPDEVLALATDGGGLDALIPFSGAWQGSWHELEVHHRWDRPVPAPGEHRAHGVTLRRLQHAWVGDGFGYNLEVAPDERPRARVLLGTVFHLRPGSGSGSGPGSGSGSGPDGEVASNEVAYLTPHLGLALAPGRVAWLTPEHLFHERVEGDRYHITQLAWSAAGARLVYETTYRRPA